MMELSFITGVYVELIVCFFFFKQKTAYEMSISDWSSDVCSSDLLWEMCASLAEGLTTGPALGYQGSVTSTKLKVSGIDVFSAGDFSGGDGTEDIDRKSVE